jgi:SPP1 gp7 family putative phage head morphogenesis protein
MTIDELLADFRRRLLDAEAATAEELAGAYAEIVDRLSVQQAQLVLQIDNLRAQGVALNAEQIRQLDGYRRLLTDVEDELDDYSRLIEAAVRRNATTAVQEGLAQAQALLIAKLPPQLRPQIEAAFNRISLEAIVAAVTMLQDGSPLAQTLARFGIDGAAGIGQALLEALLRGDGPRQAAQRMVRDWGIPLTDALRIARTEMLRSHRWATLEGYRANSDVVVGWTWYAELDGKTCMSCIALHGTEFPLEEELDDHPNGRCTPLPITKTWAELGFEGLSDLENPQEGDGERWFIELPVGQQIEMMGQSKWRAWQDGRFEFRQLAAERWDADWGRMFQEAGLAELLGVTA